MFTPSSEEKGRSRRQEHEADKARQRRTPRSLSSEPLNPEGLPGSRPEAGHWWGDCPASGGRGWRWRYKRESTGGGETGGVTATRRRKHDGSPHKGQGLVARRGRRDATPRAPMFYYNAMQKHTKLRRLALSVYMPPRACHDCRRRLEASAARRGRTAHPTFLTPSGRCAARRGRRRGGRPRSQG